MTPAGLEVRSPEDEELQLNRLRQFFTALGPLAFFFGALYGFGALMVDSRLLALSSPLGFGFATAVWVAHRMARRGRLMLSALIAGYGLLAVAALNVFTLPIIYPTLVLVCVMAVAAVLPYVKGRPLHVFLLVALAVIIENTVKGVLFPEPLLPEEPLPPALASFIALSTMAAAAFLTLLLLGQFSSRLRQALDQMLSINAALREAQAREQEAREAAEKEYRHLAAAIPQHVWTAMPDGQLDFVNRRVLDYLQLPEDRVLREGWRPVLHPDCLPRFAENWERSLATGEDFDVEVRLRRGDGTYRWHIIRALAMRERDGRIAKWFGTNTDIDDQKEIQKALRASEERFRSLTVATTQIVWTTDPDGMVVEDSPSWRAFTGQGYEEWKGEGWLDAVHPEDRERAAQTWRDAVTRRTFCEVEYRVRQRDGSYADMVVRSTPVRNEDSSIREWVGTYTDISERKRAEERLRAESRAFRESEERAREADRRKDEFLAMLGHELRNPLAPIISTLDLLRQRGELGREYATIDRQVRHVTRLVDDLLDVSRISRGKIQLKKEPLYLADSVDRALEISRPLIEQRRHELTLEVDESVRVEADPVRLAQVIANLLTNAAKYTDPGGRISVSARMEDGAAVVRVSDTGSGIPPDLLPHLFELFVQGDRSLDRSQGGLGIGLTLVKMLVEMHGGAVLARSDGTGKGSEFEVRLPLLTDTPTAVSWPAPPPNPPLELCRILVVDDNVDAADVLAECLQMSGHQVRVANDGPVALRVAAEFEPEVVLLDIGLPTMDGFEVARRLRQRQGNAPLRLIALTGYGQESDRQKARAAGFDEHMVKPVELDILTATLARIVPTRDSPLQNS